MTSCSRPHHGPGDGDLACVGSFRTAYAAGLAIDHLAEQGFGREWLAVVPADLQPTDGWRARIRRRPRGHRSLAAGLAALGLLIVATFVVPVAIVSWAFAGSVAVAGMVVSSAVAVERFRAQRIRQRARAERTIVAGRFDVVCTDDADRAGHVLARWWDPTAPPVAIPAAAIDERRADHHGLRRAA